MEFRTLGELEVWHADSPIPIQGAVQRSVLALLLLRANAVVRLEDLVEELWGPAAPHTAPKMIQNAVSKLRKSGMAGVLATRAGGYSLQIDPEQVDATRFERLVDRARESLADGMPEVAEQLLEQANSLWRGAPLADLAPESFAQLEIARLEELRLTATECSVEAGLALGRHRELASTLETLVSRYLLRETLRGQLMLSLYRSGRQADALQAYRDGRRLLASELGLEPISFVAHGIGLHLHEEPYMGRYGDEIVEAGMVGAFEPLVYIPGRFGMQNKDMFCVTEAGCELLSDYTPTDTLLRVG